MDAIGRTLRDIHEGHITLVGTITRFDTDTGEPLPEPVVDIGSDRAPALGVPGWPGPWWETFAANGWLRLVEVAGRARYLLSDAGLAELARRGGAS